MRLALFLSLGLAACAPRGTGPIAEHPDRPMKEEAPAGPSGHPKRASVPDDVVERAAAPFVGLRVDGRELTSPEGLLDEVSRADVICAGEEHSDALSHYAELVLLTALIERSPMNGREVGLGLEMVARPEQGTLDAYSHYELDEAELLKESRWTERWGWDFAYYRPMLELARHRGVPLVALNAPRELTRAVARKGLHGLTHEQEKRLPELDLGDTEHRAWFEKTMKHHPHGKPEHMYAAQVVWDETMAESAARWLSGKLPGRQLLILAGAGHCRADAIPKRLTRRAQAKVVSVRALRQGEEQQQEALEAYDFALVFEKSP